MVFDGQSLNNWPPAVIDPFPVRVMAGRGKPFVCCALNGVAYFTLLTDVATRRNPLFSQSDYTVMVMTGGTGDIGASRTAAQTLADMQTYASTARTAGCDAIIASTIPTFAGITGPQETERLAVNVLIRGRAGLDWELCADLAGDPRLQNIADTTYFLVDQIHFTAAGHQVAADIIGPLLTSLL